MSHTKDEKYLLALYDIASSSGDPQTECDLYAVGNRLGLHENTVNNIVKLLAQTNFIKKKGDNFIALTDHGLRLIESLKKL